MDFHYEIKNERLKENVEKKANELNMTVDDLIWGYINRGLMSDALSDEVFNRLHSNEYLSKVNETLGIN